MSRKFFWTALYALAIVLFANAAFAQPTPSPVPTLSTAQVVVTVLSLVLGVVNALIQNGKIGVWQLPTTATPYLLMIGSFLGGVYAYLNGLPSPLVISSAVIFFAVVSGVQQLLVASAPGIVAHHFGGVVRKAKLPPKADINNAPTDPPPPPSNEGSKS